MKTHTEKRILVGALLLLSGVVLMLQYYNLVPWEFPGWLISWKSMLFLIGLVLVMGITGGGYLNRLVIRSHNNIHVVHCDDVLCLEADDDYVNVHGEKDRWQKKQTLKFYEDKLNPDEFLRVHRSFIVRVAAITRIEPYSKDAYIAVLINGMKISVSKTGYHRLRELFDF